MSQQQEPKNHFPTILKLRGVGKQIAKHLARLNIHTILDLLLHLPAHYQDRTKIMPIRTLVPGAAAVVEGMITTIDRPPRGRTKLLCELKDNTGRLFLRFFNVLPFQTQSLIPGARLRCYSEVRLGQKGLEMVHPDFQVIVPGKECVLDKNLTPIYPATAGLSQYTLRKLTGHALEWLENQSLIEMLPMQLLESLALPPFKKAVAFLHRPPRETAIEHLMENTTHAHKRLIIEELLAHRISLLQVKEIFKSQISMSFAKSQKLSQTFLAKLPYQLTNAQKRVINEISDNLTRNTPMLRLVQGDVGCGKTIVSAFAVLQAVEAGAQAALMVPTELLAEQHYHSFQSWFEPLGVSIAFLSSQIKGRARAKVLNEIATGRAAVVLGTHALFQQEVNFKNLGLIIADEQHRFGVEQRTLLREKGRQSDYYPHQLVMTATPIPRTLAMSLYAGIDCSVIDELPPGRTQIVTSLIDNSRRDEVIARVRQACQSGRQVYWVCPLIEESEAIIGQAATKTAELLTTLLPDIKIGLVHGRMKSDQKEATMRAFKEGDIQILVATTVIEVGVDVPKASIIVIENAERLGLSQLHQLRGRVGRGSIASHCLLLYQQPLSALAQERLQVMRNSTDGFTIAQRDLELRGPGEVFGIKQTGELAFRIADLLRDNHLFPFIEEAAKTMMQESPEFLTSFIDQWLGMRAGYGKI